MKVRAEWRPVPDPPPTEYQYYFDIDSDPDFKFCCEPMSNVSTSGPFAEIMWTNETTGQLMWKNKPITECPWCEEAIEIEKVGQK